MIERDPSDDGLNFTTLPKNLLLSLLNGDNFGFFNRELAHAIGLHEAIIFSELVAKYQYLQKNDNLKEIDGHKEFFEFTFEDLQERTCLGRKPQDSAIKELIKLGFVEKRGVGLPMRRYFRIHLDHLYKIPSIQKKFTKLSKRDNQEGPKGTTRDVQNGQSHHIYKTTYETKEKYEKEKSRSAPPSSLCFEKGKVKMTHSNYEKLLEDFGQEKISELIDRLDEYADINPKRFKQYANHATVIRSWIRKESGGEAPNNGPIQAILEQMKKSHAEYIKNGEIHITNQGVTFQQGTFYLEILFADKRFVDKLSERLSKMGKGMR